MPSGSVAVASLPKRHLCVNALLEVSFIYFLQCPAGPSAYGTSVRTLECSWLSSPLIPRGSSLLMRCRFLGVDQLHIQGVHTSELPTKHLNYQDNAKEQECIYCKLCPQAPLGWHFSCIAQRALQFVELNVIVSVLTASANHAQRVL